MLKASLMPAALVLGLAGPGEAHEQWADGEPVPSWVAKQCCGIGDAHHLHPDDVHVTAEGYRVNGYNGLIRQERRLVSPDGEWWVFYRDYTDGTQSPVFCFFGPPTGS